MLGNQCYWQQLRYIIGGVSKFLDAIQRIIQKLLSQKFLNFLNRQLIMFLWCAIFLRIFVFSCMSTKEYLSLTFVHRRYKDFSLLLFQDQPSLLTKTFDKNSASYTSKKTDSDISLASSTDSYFKPKSLGGSNKTTTKRGNFPKSSVCVII